MKDKRTLFAFIVLIFLVGIVIALSVDKRVADNKRDIKIDSLAGTVENLIKQVSDLKVASPVNGVTPVKGIDYVDGANGLNGKNGSDGKDGSDGEDGRDGVDGKDGKPAAELDIDCISNHLMKKYTNDDFWQATNIKCEVGS